MHIDPQLKTEIKEYIRKKLLEVDRHPLVTIISAYSLDEKEVSELKAKIGGLEKAILHFEVDQSLLAGVIIKYGSRMIDFSLKSELQTLQHLLYESA